MLSHKSAVAVAVVAVAVVAITVEELK